MADAITLFLLFAAIIIIGVAGEIIFSKTGIPDVLWLVFVGILLVPVFGVISKDVLWSFTPLFSALALIIILFDGGMHLRLNEVFKEAPKSFFLALTGFIISMAFVAAATEALAFFGFLKNWSLLNGILLGAIMGGTSSIIVMPLVSRMQGLKKNVSSLLSIESTLTDSFVIVVVISLLQVFSLNSGIIDLRQLTSSIAGSFLIGIAAGTIAGMIWIKALQATEKFKRYHYIITFAFLLLTYSAVELINGSGALAVLAIGIIFGNSTRITSMFSFRRLLVGEEEVNAFHAQVSFFVKTFFFALIGMLLVFSIEIMAIALGLTMLLLLARIIATKIIARGKEFSAFDRKAISVFMPRGLAAAVMAVLPLSYGIAGAEIFSELVFAVILFSIIVCTLGVFSLKFSKNGETAAPEEKTLEPMNITEPPK